MGSIFNQDFLDFIDALNRSEVEYILVGGYAVILHGYNRTTGDLDIWVNPTEENYCQLVKAFDLFGLYRDAISKRDFLNTSDFEVFTFGRPPVSIDIMTKVKGLSFNKTYELSKNYETNGISIKLIQLNSLIKAKVAAGRFKDKNDIQHLEEE